MITLNPKSRGTVRAVRQHYSEQRSTKTSDIHVYRPTPVLLLKHILKTRLKSAQRRIAGAETVKLISPLCVL